MFDHESEAALRSAAALVNTEPEASHSGADELTRVDDVTAFFAAWGYTGLLEQSEPELQRVRALRAELRRFFTETRDEAAEHANRVLADASATPRLVRHDGFDWHLHAVPDDAPFEVRIRVETAMSMLDLVRGDELERLKVCAADDCTAVLVDLSKNRSKRFCDVGNCGNRANVTAYRARKAAAGA